MSKYKFLKPTSVVICGAIVGYFSAQVFLAQNSPQSQNRFLASATISKLGSEQYARTFFDMKIKNEKIATTANEVSVVKVSVEAFQKLPTGLTYSWHLPEGATLVEGLQTGSISELDVDQIQDEFEKVVPTVGDEVTNTDEANKTAATSTTATITTPAMIKTVSEIIARSVPFSDELPGCGQYYCPETDRHFIDQKALDDHKKTKFYKKRIKQLQQEKYTQHTADWASGMSKELLPPAHNSNTMS